jgi:hypothetical protein
VVTDFAADVPFARAMDKLVEHYGVLLSESVIRRVALAHGRAIWESDAPQEAWPAELGAEQIIAEMDGGMVPIMEPEVTQTDRRKGKHLRWKEAKIALAHSQGSQTLAYGGTLEGDASQAGRILFDTACRAGFGRHSRLHAVGDGARWIADQVEERFGQNGRYLLDFFHVCDYLNAAAQAIATTGKTAQAWMETQKNRLKHGQAQSVLDALEPYQENQRIEDDQAPVRVCHRYLNGRLEQLHYDDALRRDLPIGSGEIESAHRYLVQQRLKRPGAWWRTHNAEYLLALRLNRANHRWHDYWKNLSQNTSWLHQFESHPETAGLYPVAYFHRRPRGINRVGGGWRNKRRVDSENAESSDDSSFVTKANPCKNGSESSGLTARSGVAWFDLRGGCPERFGPVKRKECRVMKFHQLFFRKHFRGKEK